MSDSTVTIPAAVMADVRHLERHYTGRADQALTMADRFVRIIAGGVSASALSRHLRANTNPLPGVTAPSVKTICQYVNTRRAMADDVTASAFLQALREAQTEAREAGKSSKAERVAAAAEAADPVTAEAPTERPAGERIALTPRNVTALLEATMRAASRWSAEDRAIVAAAMAQAASAIAPTMRAVS